MDIQTRYLNEGFLDRVFWGITRLLTSPCRYVSGLAIRSASIPLSLHRVWLRIRYATLAHR